MTSAQDSPDVQRLAGGAAVQLVGKVVGRAAALGVHLLLSRVLGPENYGLYALGWTVFTLLGLFSTLGMEHAVVRFASPLRQGNPGGVRAVVRRTMVVTLLSGAAVSAALYLAAPWVADTLFHKPRLTPALEIFAVGVFCAGLLRVGAAASRVSQRMAASALTEDLVQPLSHLLLTVGVILAEWELRGAALAGVASFALAAVVAEGLLHRLFPDAPPNATGTPTATATLPRPGALLAFSLAASLTGILSLLSMIIDRLLVGGLRPAAEVGFYNAASQISFFFVVVLTAFNAIFAPMIADLYHHGEHRRLGEIYRVGAKWGIYLTTPLFLTALLAPEVLLIGLFGRPYAAGGTALAWLATGQMINIATGAVGFLLIMSGRQHLWLLLAAGALGLNTALNLWWIPLYGIAGAAAATALVTAALFLGGLGLVWKILRLWPWDGRLWKGAAAAVVAVGCLLLVRQWGLPTGPLGAFALLALVHAAFALPLALLTRRSPDEEDRQVFHLIRGRLRRRSDKR